jgi:hypothetical protein
MANYPSTPVVFPTRSDGQAIFAQHTNDVQDEVAALEAALLGVVVHAVNFGKAFHLSAQITPPVITANPNDYSPVGLVDATHLRLTTDAARTITGIVGSASNGRVLVVTNIGTFPLTLAHDDVLSSVGARILCPNNVAVTLGPNQSALLSYDIPSSHWRVVTASPSGGGLWTSYAVSWTATGGGAVLGNGTVASRYAVVGKTVTVFIAMTLGSTTVQGTGVWLWSLPPGLPAAASQTIGFARISQATHGVGSCTSSGTAAVSVLAHGTTGFIGPGVPAAWGTGNSVALMLTYETP